MPSSGKRVTLKSESAQDGALGEGAGLVQAEVASSAAVRVRRGRRRQARGMIWMFMTATVANAPSPAVASGSLFCRFFVVGFCPLRGDCGRGRGRDRRARDAG